MKTKQTGKGGRGTEHEERNPVSEESGRKPNTPQPKTPLNRQTSCNTFGKKSAPSVSKDVTSFDKKTRSGSDRSPQMYKSVHNIGRRKATEHVVSYKETEIAVCFKDSYWPNAKLDLSAPTRTESSQGKGVLERASGSPASTNEGSSKREEKVENRQKPEKVQTQTPPINKNETKPDLHLFSISGETSLSQPLANKRTSMVEGQKATKRKLTSSSGSQIQKRTLRTSDESTKKADEDDEVEALISAAVSTDSDSSGNEVEETSPKAHVRLSSKKRAELSFLARGILASGGSDAFIKRAKKGDQQQNVRVRRTASLNAGAIVSLMLQKEKPASKKHRTQWDDDDDNDDSDTEDSMSSSSDSVDSSFSEYSAPGESRQLKKTSKTATGNKMAAKAFPPPGECSKDTEKASLRVKLVLPAEAVGAYKETSVPKEVGRYTQEPALENVVASSSRGKMSLNDASCSPKQSTSLDLSHSVGGKTVKASTTEAVAAATAAAAAAVAAVKNTSPNLQNPENEIFEARGKRKRKEFENHVPMTGPGKRMASLNAQAILAASRDERIKRSRLIEGSTKSGEVLSKNRSLSKERNSEVVDASVQSKSNEKSGSADSGKTTISSTLTVCPLADSHPSTKTTICVCTNESSAVEMAALSASATQSSAGDRLPFPSGYVELVSPTSSIQRVEMTSAPVLTPNKTYQQLDRPQNCQQYSSDRQPAPVWSGNPYNVSQFHELNSSNGHPIDFHKGSSDRLLEKPQSNIVTALIPHATSLAPAVPIRFTAHIVPQNPLPQHGFYSQLQPHPSYYSDRYPYAGPNLFSYPGKAFNTSTSFAAPHIPTDLYNASRQLQVYEVQATRPVYGRQSDFNLQLCQPQFIGPLTGPVENRDQLQQLYRPYLSPPAHQSFQHPQHPNLCTSYVAPQVQVALTVPGLNPLPPEKQPGTTVDSHSSMPDQKLLKTSPSDSQPKLTDISYSVVKKGSLSSRRRQVETKHSSTQVKCHDVGSVSGASSAAASGSRDRTSPECPKPNAGKLNVRAEKSEDLSASEVRRSSVNAYEGKVAPPAHCQSYTFANKPGNGVEDLRLSDLRNYNASLHKPCSEVRQETSQNEYLAKQEDAKLVISAEGSVSDARQGAVAREPVSVIPYSKIEVGDCQRLTSNSTPIKGLHRRKMILTAGGLEVVDSSSRARSGGVTMEMHSSTVQTSIIDLSQEKELDLSNKPKAVEALENPVCATPLKKKILKNRKIMAEPAMEDSTNTASKSVDSVVPKLTPVTSEEGRMTTTGHDSSNLSSTCGVGRSTSTRTSSLCQLEKFVATQSEPLPDHGVVPHLKNVQQPLYPVKSDATIDKTLLTEDRLAHRSATEASAPTKEPEKDSTGILKCSQSQDTGAVGSPLKTEGSVSVTGDEFAGTASLMPTASGELTGGCIIKKPVDDHVIDNSVKKPDDDHVIDNSVKKPDDDHVIDNGIKKPDDDHVMDNSVKKPVDDHVMDNSVKKPVDDHVIDNSVKKPDDDHVMDNSVKKPDEDHVMDNSVKKPVDDQVDNSVKKPDDDHVMDNSVKKPVDDQVIDNRVKKPDEGPVMDNSVKKPDDHIVDKSDNHVIDHSVIDIPVTRELSINGGREIGSFDPSVSVNEDEEIRSLDASETVNGNGEVKSSDPLVSSNEISEVGSLDPSVSRNKGREIESSNSSVFVAKNKEIRSLDPSVPSNKNKEIRSSDLSVSSERDRGSFDCLVSSERDRKTGSVDLIESSERDREIRSFDLIESGERDKEIRSFYDPSVPVEEAAAVSEAQLIQADITREQRTYTAIDLTAFAKSDKALREEPDQKDGMPSARDQDIPETVPLNENMAKPGAASQKKVEKTSLKTYGIRGLSFRNSAPLKRMERSTKLARKRMNSVGFGGGRNSSDKDKLQTVELRRKKKFSPYHSSCRAARGSVEDGDPLAKLGTRKGKKALALLMEGKTKKLMPLRSVSRQKILSEKDKVRKHPNEEASKRRAEGIKCWKWKEPGTTKLIYTEVEGPPVQQMCYPAIEHTNGDVIHIRDCVLVRSGMRKKDIPYIAKIYGFWENQETGEMMMGVFWYYRQVSSDTENISKYLNDEVFASRHRDVIPVACIEDCCYVLTLNEFCRYKAEQKRIECNLPLPRQPVPPGTEPYSRAVFQPPADADPDTVFLCRNIYDIKLRRISRFSRKLQA